MYWILFSFLTLGGVLVVAYCVRKKMHIWLPRYAVEAAKRTVGAGSKPNDTIDVMFLLVDHFELAGKAERLEAWMARYPELADRHIDADGRAPQHSWFYALDLLHEHEVEAIGQLVDAGLGEMELHWHHDHDDEKSFLRKLHEGMAVFHRHGHMLPMDGRFASFAFIHGNWSLDNSRGSGFCGVDNEIELLLQAGCYADFTYPALFNEGQPTRSNQIHYAIDNGRPKSYNRGRRATVGNTQRADELMLFQGPLLINWRDWRFRWHPMIEDGDVNASATHGDAARVDAWVRRNIHVEGQPNWRFVKAFCHGAQDHKSVLGPASDRMFSHLEANYNDGHHYRLHYVNAREAYNIVRAAEDGKTGNPAQFRDYIVPTPQERRLMQRQRSAEQAGG